MSRSVIATRGLDPRVFAMTAQHGRGDGANEIAGARQDANE